ncbi:tRNA lysidine(34) synthetase TilS [Pseudoalteromonas sp. MMG013]|uniref:tRNA lysidine(34) synthetase TilS n=1 Tax=Pseudoalteromonas sp. MMG013 TaxID=2822687 RepID=UPI001B395211|nr:tRNA lysidine(34) synthetase TilS [Pseudoalteromonas sp. MMG013]MBQ4861023.1 tRNA lysidine(34) synthetase TilS [Pseudoalteromonas sp. MMG013]
MKSSFLFKQFNTALHQLNPTRQTLCVALSGGVDSVVLLHLCVALRDTSNVDIEAVYVHHGLSVYADDWLHFCDRLCKQLQVPFKYEYVDVEHKARHSVEAQARDVRYKALHNQASDDALIVLGQHGDDQLETFLLRLKRGSGLLGLGAMRARTQLPNGRECIRPLLHVSRDDIEAFADHYALSHIEDESNKHDHFDRNFLRNQIIPQLKTRFSGLLPSALRSIQLLQQQQQLIDEITQDDLALSICNQRESRCVDLAKLANLSPLRQKNVVRAWLALHNVAMPSLVQLEQILVQSLTSKIDAQLNIDLKSGSIKRYRGLLYWVVTQDKPIEKSNVGLDSVMFETGYVLCVKQGKGIRAPHPDEVVSIRFGCLNDKIKPQFKPGRNTVKHWLKDAKVPTWQRALVPLIYYNDVLVQVVGYYFNHDHVTQECGIYWEERSDR